MTKVSTKWVGLVGFSTLAVAFAVAGCGGSKNDTGSDSGGSAAGGGESGGSTASGNTGGSTSSGNAGGSTSKATGAGGAASTTAGTVPPVPDAVTCGPTAAPGNAMLTDFSEVTAGTYNEAKSFTWGTAKTLTGGSFFYANKADAAVTPPVEASTITGEVVNGALHVTAAIVANQFAGFGFWFGPCTDARAYQGISFKISGKTGDAELKVQMQTSRNYPEDRANSKGECQGTWGNECDSNAAVFKNLALTDTAQVIKIPWADFTLGKPITTLVPDGVAELLGMQWHFNCGPIACTPDVIIDDVTFY